MRGICRLIWTTMIDSYESLASRLAFVNDGNTDDMAAFHGLFGTETTPDMLFVSFLRGVGVPSEGAWNTYINEGLLEHVPNRAEMDNPSFRPRMLAWAMTGSPNISNDTMKEGILLFFSLYQLTNLLDFFRLHLYHEMTRVIEAGASITMLISTHVSSSAPASSLLTCLCRIYCRSAHPRMRKNHSTCGSYSKLSMRLVDTRLCRETADLFDKSHFSLQT